jgi:GrpB-like predicted nucleotidyltransferase (UPF0157 family)
VEVGDGQPIVIVDYDERWLAQFAALRERAAGALGELVLAIEHTGSTAVPGLAGKPVIDLIAVVSDNRIHEAITRLEAIGYCHEGDRGIAGREAFTWPPGEPRHHLYVCPPDNAELRRHLRFRDYLRAHPDRAAVYAALKRQAADRFRHDRAAYVEAKTEFVEETLRLAAIEGAKGARFESRFGSG